MTNYSQEIEQAVKKYRKNVEDIQNSNNPYYRDPEVKEYEVNALRAELDSLVAEKSLQFEKAIEQQIAEAEQKAKTARFYTTETAKQHSEWALDSYIADVVMARTDAAKFEAYRRFEERLNTMDEGALAHIRLKLPQAMTRINGDEIARKDLLKVNDALAALKTQEEEELDALKEQKRAGADQAYRRLRMVHPSYSHLPTNQNSGHFKAR